MRRYSADASVIAYVLYIVYMYAWEATVYLQ